MVIGSKGEMIDKIEASRIHSIDNAFMLVIKR